MGLSIDSDMRYVRQVDLGKSSVAVTGATGFLGGYLVENLLKHGAHVVAVVRNPAKAAGLASRGVEVRKADLADEDALAEGFRGCDAVISNAAAVSFSKPEETLRTNLEGTRNVFNAMARVEVRRAVMVSSTVVYPFSTSLVSERTPIRDIGPLNRLNGYQISKAASEKAAWELAKQHEIALTTVRPCAITGAEDPMFMFWFKRLLSFPVTLFPVGLRFSIVYAGDVAEAISLALKDSEISAGKAYNTTGVAQETWQMADLWRDAGGRSPMLRLPVPLPFSMCFDDRLVRDELGWRPRGTFQTVKQTLAGL